MTYSIFLAKESRAGESRVALIPSDVSKLIHLGHRVWVEDQAGAGASYLNSDYEAAGAQIVCFDPFSLSDLKGVFSGKDIIVRAKRPCLAREAVEAKAFHAGMIMIGALDPFEPGSNHIDQYQQAGIDAYSIDQLKLAFDDPMNILAAMSAMTGRLALHDGISKLSRPAHKVVIIGFGAVGRSALQESVKMGLHTVVITGSKPQTMEGAEVVYVRRDQDLTDQQKLILQVIRDADLVIAASRASGQKAPILIPMSTILQMKKGSVILDLAIAEGGNVEGSQHDQNVEMSNGVIVTNVSGYPKAEPEVASRLWSRASVAFIKQLYQSVDQVEDAKIF